MHFALLAVAAFVAYFASAQSATPGVLTGLPTLTATPTYWDAACNSSITSYIEGIPTPPPAFTDAPDFNYIAGDLEDICVVEAELPSSLLSAYTSYNSAVSSYIREKIPELEEIRSICPPRNGGVNSTPVSQAIEWQLSDYSVYLASGCSTSKTPTSAPTTPQIATATASSTGPTTNLPSSPTSSSALSSASSSASSSTATGAAPRGTGRAVAAAAIIAAGVVAAL